MYQAVKLSTQTNLDDGKFTQIISHLILMTPIMPLDLYLVYDILCILNKKILENEHLTSRFRDEFFEISHPDNFSNLAHVQYVFLDKTGTMTENRFQMSQIYFNGKIFQFENLDKLYLNMKTQSTANHTLQVKSNANTQVVPLNSREELGSYIFDNNKGDSKALLPIPTEQDETSEMSKRNSRLSPRKSITHDYNTFKSTKNIFSTTVKPVVQPMLSPRKESKIQIDVPNYEIRHSFKANYSNNENDQKSNSINNSIVNPPTDEKEIQTKINVFRKNQKFQTLNLMNYKTKELDKSLTYIDFIYDQDDFFNDFNKSKKDKGNFEFQELFECFSLCHSSKSQANPYTKQIFYESEHKDEESLLEFSKNCNFVYERSDNIDNPTEYHILYKNFKSKYQLMGINNFSYQRKVFSIVYKHPFTSKYFLVCKGSLNSIRSKLSLKPEEEEKLDNIIRQFHNKGLIPIIYSKRELIKEEAEVFKRRMKNLKSSLINQSDQLEKLADDIEINLRIVCIVGFKNDLKPDAVETVEFFKTLNIETWLLTGDTKESAVQAAYSSGLIDLSNDTLSVVAETKSDLLFAIRNILLEIKVLSFNKIDIKSSTESVVKQSKSIKNGQTYFRKCDKYLLLNGKSLDLIFSDSYLKPNFIFICSVVPIVIAYDLTPSHKAMLVKTVQECFNKNPSVLAIGDGFNDISMLQAADIGVEIVNRFVDGKLAPYIMAGDIKLSSLKQLKSLMLNKALLFADRLNYIFYFLFYKSMIFGLQIFLYNFYNDFSGSVFFDSIFVFLYYNYFIVSNILFFGIHQRSVDFKTIKKCPHLYVQGILFKRPKNVKNSLIKIMTEVTIQILIVFYLTIYSVGKSVDQNGEPFDKNLISVMCLYTCLILDLIKIYTDFRFTLKTAHFMIMFIIIPIVLIVLFLCVRPYLTYFKFKPYEINTLDILNNFILIMNLLFNGSVAFLITFALKHFWCYIFFPEPFALIKNRDFIHKYRKNHSYILNLFYQSKKFLIFHALTKISLLLGS